MTRFTKEDVEFHSDAHYLTGHAAVNVKQYHYLSTDKVMDRFGCSEETAIQAIEYAVDMHRESFWEDANNDAEYFFGSGYGVFSEGRSGGWAVVHYKNSECFDRDDVDGWDAIELSKWARFARSLEGQRDYLTSDDAIIESIEANEWALDQTAMEGIVADALA